MSFLDTIPDTSGKQSAPAPAQVPVTIAANKPAGTFLSKLPDAGTEPKTTEAPLGNFLGKMNDTTLEQKVITPPAPTPQPTFTQNVSNFFKKIPDAIGKGVENAAGFTAEVFTPPDVTKPWEQQSLTEKATGLLKNLPPTMLGFMGGNVNDVKDFLTNPEYSPFVGNKKAENALAFTKELPASTLKVGGEIAKAPLRVAATAVEPWVDFATGSKLSQMDKGIPMKIGPLNIGEVPSLFQTYNAGIKSGFTPLESGLMAGSGTAMDIVVTAGMADYFLGKQPVKINSGEFVPSNELGENGKLQMKFGPNQDYTNPDMSKATYWQMGDGKLLEVVPTDSGTLKVTAYNMGNSAFQNLLNNIFDKVKNFGFTSQVEIPEPKEISLPEESKSVLQESVNNAGAGGAEAGAGGNAAETITPGQQIVEEKGYTIPKEGSIEQMAETQEGWKPGVRKAFDTALNEGDAQAVQKMLPEVPEEYKARFSERISNLLPNQSAAGGATASQETQFLNDNLNPNAGEKTYQVYRWDEGNGQTPKPTGTLGNNSSYLGNSPNGTNVSFDPNMFSGPKSTYDLTINPSKIYVVPNDAALQALTEKLMLDPAYENHVIDNTAIYRYLSNQGYEGIMMPANGDPLAGLHLFDKSALTPAAAPPEVVPPVETPTTPETSPSEVTPNATEVAKPEQTPIIPDVINLPAKAGISSDLQPFAENLKGVVPNPINEVIQKFNDTGSAVVGQGPNTRIVIKDEGNFVKVGVDTGKLVPTEVASKFPQKTFSTKEAAFDFIKKMQEVIKTTQGKPKLPSFAKIPAPKELPAQTGANATGLPENKNIVPKESVNRAVSGSASDIGKNAQTLENQTIPKTQLPRNKKHYWYDIEKKSFIESPAAKSIEVGRGIDAFIHKNPNGKGWQVVEAKSGFIISKHIHNTRNEAAATAKANVKQVGIAQVKKLIEDSVKKFGASPAYQEKPIANQKEELTKVIKAGPKFNQAKASEEIKSEPELKQDAQAGFIDPGLIAKDAQEAVKTAKDFIEKSNRISEFTGDIDKDLNVIRTSAKADNIIAKEYLKNVNLSPADAEAIYHYSEDKNAPITQEQLDIYNEHIKPLQKARDETYQAVKGEGVPINREDYTPRFVAGKGGVFEKMKEGGKSIREGGILRKTTGSFKKRRMKAIVDDEGNRQVVSIKPGKVKTEGGKVVNLGSRVTAFNDKVPTDLGPLRQPTTPKMTEWIDEVAMKKLEKLAADLGITHERVLRGKGLGGRRAGVSFTGENRIKTKRFTPEQVILHEIGHQIDDKYNLQDIFVNDPATRKELRKLADLRWQGREIGKTVSKHFAKIYVRKGEEKMAVMFEAYLKNREGFRNVAPNTYKKFVDFLKSHEELKPILDIRPSLVLGSNKIGGPEPRNSFTDKNGKTWKIVDATTKEIEQHTNLTYHKNILLNELISYTRLKQVERATQFLNKVKESPEFSEFALKVGEGDVPKGWKPTTMPQFIGYNFEPKIADALDNFASKMKNGDVLRPLSALNTVLRTSIFFNPLIHIPNVVTHAITARGVYKYAIPSSYVRLFKSARMAFGDVAGLNETYKKMLDSGVNLMYGDTTGQLTDLMVKKMGEEVAKNPQIPEQLAKVLGVPLKTMKFIFGREGLSSKTTWFTNDFFTLQAIHEREMEGLSTEEAIKQIGKHIPNYQIPSRIFNSRVISQIMQNPNITMFGAYHYGALKSYGEMIKGLVTGNAGEHGGGYFGKESFKERAKAADIIAMAAIIGLFLYPAIDKAIKAMTGNKKAQIRRAGPITIPYNTWKLIRGKEDFSTYIQSIITPAIGTKTIAQLVTNTDFYTRQKLINQGTELSDLLTAGEKAVAPVNQAQQLISGTKNPQDLLLGLLGISTPKTTPSEANVLNLVYDRRNVIISEVKNLYAQGKTKEANDMMASFNNDLLQNSMDAFKENGYKISDENALRAYLIEHLKGNFITPPTNKQMNTFNANQKLTPFQRIIK